MWRKAKMAVSVVNTFKRSSKYKSEGDPTMDTEAMLAVRRGLQQSGAIQAQIARFWDALDMLKDPSTGGLTRASYLSLNVKIQKAMVSDFDMESAKLDAATDWHQDMTRFCAARGEEGPTSSTTMSFADFKLSMFELADLWCDDVKEATYMNFLKEVLTAVAKDINSDPLEFKPTAEIEALPFAPALRDDESDSEAEAGAEKRSEEGEEGEEGEIEEMKQQWSGAPTAGDADAVASPLVSRRKRRSTVFGNSIAALAADDKGSGRFP